MNRHKFRSTVTVDTNTVRRSGVSTPVLRMALLCCLAAGAPVCAFAAAARPAPSLGPVSGTVVDVSTEAQLQAAFHSLASNQTVRIAPGTYRLSNTLYINGTYSNLVVRGATDNS